MTASPIAAPTSTSGESRAVALPGARLALVLLLVVNLFNYIDRYVLASALPAIEKEFFPNGGPNSKTWLGALTSVFLVSYMVLAPLFGWLGDRWPRWRLIGLAVIFWSLASGASGLATTFLMLLGTRCLVGVGEAAYGPVAPTLISDFYPEKIRGRVLSWFYAAIPVGSALGYIWGGAIRSTSLGWPWAFYLVVPPGLLLGALCFLMPEPRRGQADPLSEGGRRQARFKDYEVLFRTPSYVYNTFGMAALTFAIGGVSTWMPDYIETYRHQGDPARTNAIFGGIVVISGLTATLLGGIAGDRLRSRYPGSYFLVSAAGMLAAFPCFLAVLYTPFPWAWGFLFLACFFLFFNTGPSNTILANVTHPAIRATGFAVNIFIIHLLGDAFSPLIIGRVADLTAVDGVKNMNTGFLTVSGMILVGAVCWLLGAPHLKHDTETATTRLQPD